MATVATKREGANGRADSQAAGRGAGARSVVAVFMHGRHGAHGQLQAGVRPAFGELPTIRIGGGFHPRARKAAIASAGPLQDGARRPTAGGTALLRRAPGRLWRALGGAYRGIRPVRRSLSLATPWPGDALFAGWAKGGLPAAGDPPGLFRHLDGQQLRQGRLDGVQFPSATSVRHF